MAQYWGDIVEGTPITLDVIVNADATAPILYQWFKNGIAIAGAVNSVYSFTAELDDSHASFTVFVQNPCGEELSEPVLMGTVAPPAYQCDAYEDAVLNIYGAQLEFYYKLDEDYATGVAIDYSAKGFDGYRVSANPTDPTIPETSPYMDTCVLEKVPHFDQDSGGNSKVEASKVPPDENDFLGLVDDMTMCFLMNKDDLGANTGTFAAFAINDQVTGGNGSPPIAYNLLLKQIDPPIFQYAFNPDFADYKIRYTTPEMNFSFLDNQWTLLAIHIKKTTSTLTMKVWANGVVVFDGTTTTTEAGLHPILLGHPFWILDYNYPNPIKRAPTIGYVPWGQGGPTSMYAAHFFGISGASGDQQQADLYAEFQRNFISYDN